MAKDLSEKNPFLVSVVIPSLNRAQFIVQTIESVLQQDYPLIECIVVDGGSTDGTVDLLCRYNGRLKWFSRPDHGPADAINKGWRMSSGEILAWLNADDLWAPGAVSTVVAYFWTHSKVDVVYGDCRMIDERGRQLSTTRLRDWNLRYAVEHCDHTIYQAASFMRRSILQQVGWLWPNLCHDHELWLRIGVAGGKIKRIPTPLAYARHHLENLGYNADLVIPLKLEITRKFFSHSCLPEDLQTLRNRAFSNTYFRGIDYVLLGKFRFSRDIPRCLRLLLHGYRRDKSNLRGLFRSAVCLVDGVGAIVLRRCLPAAVYQLLRSAKRFLSDGLRPIR